jgi:hypothetical protein
MKPVGTDSILLPSSTHLGRCMTTSLHITSDTMSIQGTTGLDKMRSRELSLLESPTLCPRYNNAIPRIPKTKWLSATRNQNPNRNKYEKRERDHRQPPTPPVGNRYLTSSHQNRTRKMKNRRHVNNASSSEHLQKPQKLIICQKWKTVCVT